MLCLLRNTLQWLLYVTWHILQRVKFQDNPLFIWTHFQTWSRSDIWSRLVIWGRSYCLHELTCRQISEWTPLDFQYNNNNNREKNLNLLLSIPVPQLYKSIDRLGIYCWRGQAILFSTPSQLLAILLSITNYTTVNTFSLRQKKKKNIIYSYISLFNKQKCISLRLWQSLSSGSPAPAPPSLLTPLSSETLETPVFSRDQPRLRMRITTFSLVLRSVVFSAQNALWAWVASAGDVFHFKDDLEEEDMAWPYLVGNS